MGPINSARVHCSRANSQKLWLENKKKKEKKERKENMQIGKRRCAT